MAASSTLGKKKPSIFYSVFSYLAATPAPVLAFCPPAMQSCVHTYHLPQLLAERRPRCHRWTQEPGSRLLLRLQVVIIWSLHFYPQGGLCCLYSKSSITHYQLTTVQLRGVKVRDEKWITIIINQDKSRVVWHDEMTIFCYIYICCWNRKRNDSRSMFGFSLKLWLNQTIKSLLWRKCWGKKSKSLTQSVVLQSLALQSFRCVFTVAWRMQRSSFRTEGKASTHTFCLLSWYFELQLLRWNRNFCSTGTGFHIGASKFRDGMKML